MGMGQALRAKLYVARVRTDTIRAGINRWNTGRNSWPEGLVPQNAERTFPNRFDPDCRNSGDCVGSVMYSSSAERALETAAQSKCVIPILACSICMRTQHRDQTMNGRCGAASNVGAQAPSPSCPLKGRLLNDSPHTL